MLLHGSEKQSTASWVMHVSKWLQGQLRGRGASAASCDTSKDVVMAALAKKKLRNTRKFIDVKQPNPAESQTFLSTYF